MNFDKFTMQISCFLSFEVPNRDKAEFLDYWKKLETNLKRTGSLVDARLYSEIADQENHEQLSSWLIQTLWHSGKDFIDATSTTKFQDFIRKWQIKEASFTSYPLISQNKFIRRPIRISNNLFMVIFFFTAVIIEFTNSCSKSKYSSPGYQTRKHNITQKYRRSNFSGA